MKLSNQKGFSLIELLVVVVIIGVIAGITTPYLIKAKNNAENTSAFTTMRTIFTSQIAFYTANRRYARLDEINGENRNSLGTMVDSKLIRGPFAFEMNPLNPTNEDLRDQFTIFVRKPGASAADGYTLSLDASGRITEIPPVLP